MDNMSKIKVVLIAGTVAIGAAIYFCVDYKDSRPAHVIMPVISQDIASHDTNPVNKEKPFIPRYTVISEAEHKISVPVGLTRKVLEQNLLHAAHRFLATKSADSVVVLAYRSDDPERAGGFTAGKCSLSRDLPAFEFAPVYTRYSTIFPTGTKMITSKNAKLYSNTRLKKVTARINKGVVVTVLEHRRKFTTQDFSDLYRVKANNGKSGWVARDYLSVFVPQKSASIRPTTPRTQTQERKWYEGGNLHNVTVKQWRLASNQNKLATCADFIARGITTGLLNFTLQQVYSDFDGFLKNRAQDLLLCINAYVDGSDRSYKVENQPITDVAVLACVLLGWVK